MIEDVLPKSLIFGEGIVICYQFLETGKQVALILNNRSLLELFEHEVDEGECFLLVVNENMVVDLDNP